jgi:hypothetical protein
MNLTITIGWWLAPLTVTAGAFCWAFWPERVRSHGADIAGIFYVALASIVSLLAWLIWSLLT